MERRDLKTLKVTLSGLVTFLFFTSGLYIIAALWFILTAVFIGEKTGKESN